MKHWLKYLEDLFSTAEKQASASPPFLHEPLEISGETEEALDDWRDSLRSRRLFDWLHNQYIRFKNASNYDAAIDFLNLPSSKGFVIHLDRSAYKMKEMELLLHFLKRRILGLGYKSSVSDRRSFKKGEVIHKVLRHYLKPDIRSLGTSKSDQKYGNITIELVEKNDQPAQFLFSASTYSDRNYREARPFEDLMTAVLETTE